MTLKNALAAGPVTATFASLKDPAVAGVLAQAGLFGPRRGESPGEASSRGPPCGRGPRKLIFDLIFGFYHLGASRAFSAIQRHRFVHGHVHIFIPMPWGPLF